MHVAILLSGQMRRYKDPEVQQSLQRYISLFDNVDIFISTWKDRGVSYNHGDMILRGDEGEEITATVLKSHYPNLRRLNILDLNEWVGQLDGFRRRIYEEGFEWHGMKIRGTIVPQLFGIWDAYRQCKEYMIATGKQYDLIIRCRPDAIFISHSRHMYESCIPNTIYAINNHLSGTFYPQRIYDIFFYGKPEIMEGLCDAYWNLETLISHPWQNGLHARDACRCLYVQARFVKGAAVVDIPLDVCKIDR